MSEPLPPALRTLFDRVATHFPGHTMQRVRYPDGRYRYTYASPGMRETFGLDPEAIVGQATATHDWIHADDRQRFLDALTQSALQLSTFDEEVRVFGDNGVLKWVRSIGYPRRLRDNTVVWDGIAVDVTERREAAAMLERALRLAKETEETHAQIVAAGSGRFRQQLTDIKSMIDELVPRTQEPASVMIVSTLQQAVVSILLTMDADGDITRRSSANDKSMHQDVSMRPVTAKLSERQRGILDLIAKGMTNREISDQLAIGEGTVKVHVAEILKRLGVKNRTSAAHLISNGR